MRPETAARPPRRPTTVPRDSTRGRTPRGAAATAPAERIHKVLARAGLGSRRAIERWISEGRVTVNGRPARIGESVAPGQKIAVDGKPISAGARFAPRARVILYHKPEGEICTRQDPEGRPTVFDRLPVLRNARWVSVGRLDINSGGLILFTTDGELANRLMHPSTGIEREYAVRVLGTVSEAMISQLQEGVELEDGPARFDSVVAAGGQGVNRWYHVTLKEGRKREVRRLFEAVGMTVSRLMRVRYGPVAMPPGLRQRQWRDLEGEDLVALYEVAGLTPPRIRAPTRPARGRRTAPVGQGRKPSEPRGRRQR